MYIETVPNRNSPPAILLRQAWREGKKTCKRTLANLSDWPLEKIETFRRLLLDEPDLLPALPRTRLGGGDDRAAVDRSRLQTGHHAPMA